MLAKRGTGPMRFTLTANWSARLRLRNWAVLRWLWRQCCGTTDPAEARALLEQVQASGEANAQRLYLLGEIARNENNESAMTQNLDRLRQEAPASQWFEQALLSAANRYLLDKNYDQAIDMFREIQQRFQSSPRASYASWKAAWLTYRQGRTENAKRDFENQVMWYPDRPEVPAALYWRARIAEDERDYAWRGPGIPNSATASTTTTTDTWDASGWRSCLRPQPMWR